MSMFDGIDDDTLLNIRIEHLAVGADSAIDLRQNANSANDVHNVQNNNAAIKTHAQVSKTSASFKTTEMASEAPTQTVNKMFNAIQGLGDELAIEKIKQWQARRDQIKTLLSKTYCTMSWINCGCRTLRQAIVYWSNSLEKLEKLNGLLA